VGEGFPSERGIVQELKMPPTAVVMNMFYTGLGIARSLGEQGIPVVALSSRHGIYGNFTRYARLRFCPDSREQPQELLSYLLRLGEELKEPAVIFPTRDDDLLFLNRYREELSRYFIPAMTRSDVLSACLDKWETYRWTQRAGIASPHSWLVETDSDLLLAAHELRFPCVMKPLSSSLWRQHENWEIVGGRKAISISSGEELLREYAQISRADPRVLLQEMIPGGDDQLFVAACYLDRNSNLVAGFTAQKLVQSPAIFGTGCVVQVVDRAELLELAFTLLRKMRFTGIAEVEFKWDPQCGQFKLIEVNPRPWDQHSLGKACGVDLVHLAYCEQAGLPLPAVEKNKARPKWIAEDAFFMAALRLLWRRDPQLHSVLRLARGKRIYGIWSRKDKLPFFAYMFGFLPRVAWMAIRSFTIAFARNLGIREETTHGAHGQNIQSKT
jgi:D-aspartate ligase